MVQPFEKSSLQASREALVIGDSLKIAGPIDSSLQPSPAAVPRNLASKLRNGAFRACLIG